MDNESFWGRVDKRSSRECWLWKGGQGGGRLRYGRWKKQYAHRFAYSVTHGPIPAGMQVRHSCDTPLCCNPMHLSLGSQVENNRDMVERQRQVRGERNGRCKLTTEQVKSIQLSRDTQRACAARFGVSQGLVRDIRSGRRWAHLHQAAG